ncbi:DsbA family oxidoreductase [Actinomadura parmotrematis]|uniref:DsbA family oxidoreductase n=1 Tax=Actinomadura parmotrematis TaxID=2864039 RepID=A0ABS7FR02_9ACTN|nr:DsbA family oxidoreductase [Actinomadura parmotrematis]MBW8482741.1 DsbA family oxidoreductase [Actinomadura parmotrematis]
MKVEIWSDIACPWCYIGKARFTQGLADFAHRDQVEVVFRSFELDPASPTGTTSEVVPMLAAKYGMTLEQARQAEQRVAANARDAGLDYITDGRDNGNTFDIHRLLHFAADHGRQERLLDLAYRANFAEQRSIYDRDRLLDLAAEAGLDRDAAAAVLDDPAAYADRVRADEREAAALGATGVPFFVLDRRLGVSGGQPAEVFTQALQQAWDSRSPLTTLAGAPDADTCGPDGCDIPQH